jgi:alkyl sulfatase BDS1-like metallo-beta-lactamase superfamily hydrolase
MTHRARRFLVVALPLALFALACGPSEPSRSGWAPDADAQGHTAPTEVTRAANRAFAEGLPLADAQDFEDAERGLVARDPSVVVPAETGGNAWDTDSYSFQTGEAPDSVNPSLWRQARLNNLHGLYRVTDGVYQVRGYDLSNMTIIQGQTGWIIVDPLTSRETAEAALALARRELGEAPVVAVILTHSHIDHFGGIRGVLPEGPAAEDVRIIAPAGFMEEATSENVMAGIAMGRRASFMYGRRLARSPRGHVGSGLGKEPAFGRIGIAAPSEVIDGTPQEKTIDGLRFVFQYAPESEAPAELTFYLPDKKAFCGAEVVSHTMHNLYTLRGAKVRDALRWSGYIDEAIALFDDVEVMYASHHWPMWGHEWIVDYLEKQRDTYKFIHDQTLRLANSGYTPAEIAESIELPASLAASFPSRGYYGSVRHNAKAVYQWYFGWYDGVPANLDPLPAEANSRKMVEFMGGANEVLRKSQASFDAGEYRWTATVLQHLVFAAPDNAQARELLARAYEQLGYQAESGPWRDVYLSGAYELRHGLPEDGGFSLSDAVDLLGATPMLRFLEATATRIDGAKAEGKEITVNFIVTDTDESYVLELVNSVLHPRRAEPDPAADVTIRITRTMLVRLLAGLTDARELVFSDDLEIDGSRVELLRFLALMDRPDTRFAIVTP